MLRTYSRTHKLRKWNGARDFLRNHFRQYCQNQIVPVITLSDKHVCQLLNYLNINTENQTAFFKHSVTKTLLSCLKNFPKYLRFNAQLANENGRVFTTEFADFIQLCKEELQREQAKVSHVTTDSTVLSLSTTNINYELLTQYESFLSTADESSKDSVGINIDSGRDDNVMSIDEEICIEIIDSDEQCTTERADNRQPLNSTEITEQLKNNYTDINGDYLPKGSKIEINQEQKEIVIYTENKNKPQLNHENCDEHDQILAESNIANVEQVSEHAFTQNQSDELKMVLDDKNHNVKQTSSIGCSTTGANQESLLVVTVATNQNVMQTSFNTANRDDSIKQVDIFIDVRNDCSEKQSNDTISQTSEGLSSHEHNYAKEPLIHVPRSTFQNKKKTDVINSINNESGIVEKLTKMKEDPNNLLRRSVEIVVENNKQGLDDQNIKSIFDKTSPTTDQCTENNSEAGSQRITCKPLAELQNSKQGFDDANIKSKSDKKHPTNEQRTEMDSESRPQSVGAKPFIDLEIKKQGCLTPLNSKSKSDKKDRTFLKTRIQNYAINGYTPLSLQPGQLDVVILKILGFNLKNLPTIYQLAIRNTVHLYLDKFHLLVPVNTRKILSPNFDLEYLKIRNYIRRAIQTVNYRLRDQLTLLQTETESAEMFKNIPNRDNLVLNIELNTSNSIPQISLFNIGNLTEIRMEPTLRSRTYKNSTATKCVYNFPDIGIECSLNNICFSRDNVIRRDSIITSATRTTQPTVNKRLLRESLLNIQETPEHVAFNTKFLRKHFAHICDNLRKANVFGTDFLTSVCSQFIKDIEYISPNRKSIVLNSEVHFSLNTYSYLMKSIANSNGVTLIETLNPTVKVMLFEQTIPQVYLKYKCLSCDTSFNVLNNQNAFESFCQHFVMKHHTSYSQFTCSKCSQCFSFEILLGNRWQHTCDR